MNISISIMFGLVQVYREKNVSWNRNKYTTSCASSLRHALLNCHALIFFQNPSHCLLVVVEKLIEILILTGHLYACAVGLAGTMSAVTDWGSVQVDRNYSSAGSARGGSSLAGSSDTPNWAVCVRAVVSLYPPIRASHVVSTIFVHATNLEVRQ